MKQYTIVPTGNFTLDDPVFRRAQINLLCGIGREAGINGISLDHSGRGVIETDLPIKQIAESVRQLSSGTLKVSLLRSGFAGLALSCLGRLVR